MVQGRQAFGYCRVLLLRREDYAAGSRIRRSKPPAALQESLWQEAVRPGQLVISEPSIVLNGARETVMRFRQDAVGGKTTGLARALSKLGMCSRSRGREF